MTLSKPEGEGMPHTDITGNKAGASEGCAPTIPRARRTVVVVRNDG